MSTPELARPRPLRPGPRWFAAILCVLLLGLCVAAAVNAVAARQQWIEAAGDRWGALPGAVAETAAVIENGGEAALVVAEAVLERSPTPEGRARVQSIVLLALAAEPGSAFGRLLLGRSAVPEAKEKIWARPLQLAVSAAPGLDLGTSELAIRYLASWTSLSAEQRRDATAVLQRAFRNPSFVRATFATAVAALGAPAAVAALPEDQACLRAAAEAAGPSGGAAAELINNRLRALPGGSGTSRPVP